MDSEPKLNLWAASNVNAAHKYNLGSYGGTRCLRLGYGLSWVRVI